VRACEHAGMLKLARVPTPSSPVREVERERDQDIKRERERHKERERDVENGYRI